MLYKKTSSYSYEQYQSAIKKLKTFILKYTGNVYTPLIKKYKSLKNDVNSPLEQFCFTVVDAINTKLEKVTKKFAMDINELYFDDGLELSITVKNSLLSKFPIRHLHFDDLDTKNKKVIIQILKTEF